MLALVACKKEESYTPQPFVGDSATVNPDAAAEAAKAVDPNDEYLDNLEYTVNEAKSYFATNSDIANSIVRDREKTDFARINNLKQQINPNLSSDQQSRLQNINNEIESLSQTIKDYYKNEAERVVRQCVYKIVEQSWQGGKDIQSVVDNVSTTDSGLMSMDIRLAFKGQITDTYYEAGGVMDYNLNSGEFTFSPSYKNKNLESYENTYNITVTGAQIYQMTRDNQ